MSNKRNPNQESPDIPNYLNISNGKYYPNTSTDFNEKSSSKRTYPLRMYGVSEDAPSTFITKNTLLHPNSLNRVFYKDMEGKDEKGQILTRELMTEWPIKFIHTHHYEGLQFPNKLTIREGNTKSLYNPVLDESKIVKGPETVIREETLYKQKFKEAMEGVKTFYKKPGYFQLFMRQQKTTNAQLKINKAPSNGHSRYISQPVVLTTLNSRNFLNKRSSLDHTNLLKSITQNGSPRGSAKAEELAEGGNMSTIVPNRSTVPTVTSNNDYVEFDNKIKKITIKPLSNETPRSQSARPVHNEIIYSKPSSRSPATERGIKPSQGELYPKDKLNLTSNMLRYDTKNAMKLISKQVEQDIRIDPHVYIKHIRPIDNKRDASIELSVVETSRRQNRADNSFTIRQASAPRERVVCTEFRDNISKFERHIDGLKKISKNFGHQRWFYQRDWRLDPFNPLKTESK